MKRLSTTTTSSTAVAAMVYGNVLEKYIQPSQISKTWNPFCAYNSRENIRFWHSIFMLRVMRVNPRMSSCVKHHHLGPLEFRKWKSIVAVVSNLDANSHMLTKWEGKYLNCLLMIAKIYGTVFCWDFWPKLNASKLLLWMNEYENIFRSYFSIFEELKFV